MYTNLPNPIIKTPRLTIRFVDFLDANDYFELTSNANVAKYLSFNPFKNIKECNKTIENMIRANLTGTDVNFSIVLNENKEVIGSISLTFHKQDDDVELGYLLKENYWNNGYMYEAINGLIKVAFSHYKANTVYATYIKENIASEKLLLKVGFIIDDKFNQTFNKNGHIYRLKKAIFGKKAYCLQNK